ncbi:hypothetical protein VTN00DRAFT_4998 [Thermoascus crustaceus]|uniref:uncharacterized protein n=1 Tax=Thermoascus crustaceus TaxID=5088 RepID=UPI0037428506
MSVQDGAIIAIRALYCPILPNFRKGQLSGDHRRPQAQPPRLDSASSGFHRRLGHFPRTNMQGIASRRCQGAEFWWPVGPRRGLVIHDLVARAGQWECEK